MSKDKIKGTLGAVSVAAAALFGTNASAQVPGGPAAGSHAATAQACMQQKIQDAVKAGKQPTPQDMQACMITTGPMPANPAAAMGVTPEQYDAMVRQRQQQTAAAAKDKAAGSDRIYGLIDSQLNIPGKLDREDCQNIGETLQKADKISGGTSPARAPVVQKYESKCGPLKPGG